MPTAALAPTASLPARATMLGFSGPPKAESQPARTAVTPDGLKQLTLKAGLSGGPVIDERGRMVGLVAAPGVDGAGKASFHPADEVAKALKAARIQPQRSAVDSTFEEAINYFSGQHDRHAAERLFDRVLSFYPKHALAMHLRDDSRKLADTPQDRSDKMDEHGGMTAAPADGGSLTPWLVTGVIGLLALAGAAVFWRRRRVVDGSEGTAAPAAAAPVTAGAASPRRRHRRPTAGRQVRRRPGPPPTRPSAPAGPPSPHDPAGGPVACAGTRRPSRWATATTREPGTAPSWRRPARALRAAAADDRWPRPRCRQARHRPAGSPSAPSAASRASPATATAATAATSSAEPFREPRRRHGPRPAVPIWQGG